MNDRVYILLDIIDGKAGQAAKVLRKSQGVIMVDALESPPDVIIVIGAPTREQLARLTVQALASVENITEQVRLLPSRDMLNKKASINTSAKNRIGDNRGNSETRHG